MRAPFVTHRLPIVPGGVTPCCGRQPAALGERRHTFTFRHADVTCRGRTSTRVPWGMLTVVLALGWLLDASTVHAGPNWPGVVLGFAALASFVAYAVTERR